MTDPQPTTPATPRQAPSRLFSLDVFRGADILLIAEENADLRRAVQGRPDRPGEYRTCYVTVPPTGDRDAFVFQASIVLQELALRMSIAKAAVLDAAGVREHGVHPDVPKNVSKSITVD